LNFYSYYQNYSVLLETSQNLTTVRWQTLQKIPQWWLT